MSVVQNPELYLFRGIGVGFTPPGVLLNGLNLGKFPGGVGKAGDLAGYFAK